MDSDNGYHGRRLSESRLKTTTFGTGRQLSNIKSIDACNTQLMLSESCIISAVQTLLHWQESSEIAVFAMTYQTICLQTHGSSFFFKHINLQILERKSTQITGFIWLFGTGVLSRSCLISSMRIRTSVYAWLYKQTTPGQFNDERSPFVISYNRSALFASSSVCRQLHSIFFICSTGVYVLSNW